MENNPSQEESSTHEESSSDQEQDQEVTFNPSHAPRVIPSMFMPYIKGPNLEWAVNDGQ